MLLRSEKGMLPVIVLMAILLLGTVGLYFISTSTFDLDASLNLANKAQSKYAAEYAMQQYLKNLKAQIFGEPGVPTKGYIPDENIKAAYYDLTSNGTMQMQVAVSYQPGQPNLYHINPPVDNDFSLLKAFNEQASAVSVSGIFNKTLNAAEFYIAFLLKDQNKVRLYRYQPQSGAGVELLTDISNVTGDSLALTAIWNDVYQATSIYIAVANRDAHTVTVYGSWPYVGTDMHQVDQISMAPDMISMTGVWDKNLQVPELFLTVLSGGNTQTYNSYPTLDGRFLSLASQGLNAKAIGTAAFWDENISSSIVYIGVLEANNNKASFYSLYPHQDNHYSFLNSLDVSANCVQIGLGGYWDQSLNSIFLYTAVGDEAARTVTPYFSLPQIGGGWTALQPKTTPVGNISIAGVYYDFPEVLLLTGVPVIRYVTYTSTQPATVIGKSLKINDAGQEIETARTTINVSAEIQYSQEGEQGVKTLEYVRVLNAEYDP